MLTTPAKGLEGPESPLWTETLPLGGEDLSLAHLHSHPAHKPKTLFGGSPPGSVFPYEGSSPTFGHSSRMGDQCAVCSDTWKAHSFPCGTLSTGTPASPYTESSQGSGHPPAKRIAESKGAPQNYVLSPLILHTLIKGTEDRTNHGNQS